MARSERALERVVAPSLEAFKARYLRPRHPVVITGATNDWAALQRWTPDYLKKTIGNTQTHVYRDRTGKKSYGYSGLQRSENELLSIAEYIDKVEGREGAGLLEHYLKEIKIPETFPQLLADFSTPIYVGEGAINNFWYGPAGFTTRCHYDFSPNILAQVTGKKRFTLFSPKEWRKLYPHSVLHAPRFMAAAQVDIHNPDYAKHPAFKDAVPYVVTLEPGELLFLPAGWWHEVHAVETGISLNFWFNPSLRDFLEPSIMRAGMSMSIQTLRGLARRVGIARTPESAQP